MISDITDDKEKIQIVQSILRDLPDWFGSEDGIQEYLENIPNCKVYSYEVENQIVGFISTKEVGKDIVEIYIMGILPNYHRRGIGKIFVDYIKECASNTEYSKIFVKTLSSKHPDPFYKKTREFYLSQGFKAIRETDEWGKDNPCVIMEYRF